MLREKLEKYANPKIITIAALATIASTLAGKALYDHFYSLTANPAPGLFLHFFLSNPAALLQSYNQQALSFLNFIQLADIVFPAIYAAFFSLILIHLTNDRYANFLIRNIFILPLIAAAFDYLGNVSIFIYLHAFTSNTVAQAAAFFIFIKWMMLVSSLTSILTLTVRSIFVSMKKVKK